MQVLSPIDAATAINSERFINLLVGEKGSKDVKTYTQKTSSSNSSHHRHMMSNTWGISKWMMFGGDRSSTVDGDSSNDNDSLAKTATSLIDNHMYSVETITEYKASLWFLSNKSKGMRFRETIRILSISSDGQSSTVECISQYHNGSKWVDCSKVICNFSSEDSTRVRMILDGEVLVWLPLPKSAARAVGKKIINVFEQAALTFFDELATS